MWSTVCTRHHPRYSGLAMSDEETLKRYQEVAKAREFMRAFYDPNTQWDPGPPIPREPYTRRN